MAGSSSVDQLSASSDLKNAITEICASVGNRADRMMDICVEVQRRLGCISRASMREIAACTASDEVEVESLVSFYSFLSENPKGQTVIRLCNDPVDKMLGVDAVAQAFEEELSIGVGETTEDGLFTLEWTPCIGMSDQAPAALVNDTIVTFLTPMKARQIVASLRQNPDPQALVTTFGDGNNSHPLIRSMVENRILKAGPITLAGYTGGAGLARALEIGPEAIIAEMDKAFIRGYGGAGFPTGRKWAFCRQAPGDNKVIICNADEGEPGTFKDRVLLTERPGRVIEGMSIAAYAVGATEGIIYLRGEYEYLRPYLNHCIDIKHKLGMLGENIGGVKGFNFDVRVQMGAGAYMCGEESALISSCEGLRGDAKNRPPFPAEKGYLGRPTVVNNVETLVCAPHIVEKGGEWFASFGSDDTSGTKVLSISGDCERSGVYEVEFGTSLAEVLGLCGGSDAAAVLVGGPSGRMVAPHDFDRRICGKDLVTCGAVVVFGPQRNLIEIVREYIDFFIDECCGYCTPCRVGNVLMKKQLDNIIAGKGTDRDLEDLKELGKNIKTASRCGLGQTSPNPILSTLENFPEIYQARVRKEEKGMNLGFDLKKAVKQAEQAAGRKSQYTEH